MGDGWHVCGGRVAGGSPEKRRGLDAYRLLPGIFSGGARELFSRCALWLARDVRHRRLARAPGGLHSLWCDRFLAVEKEVRGAGAVVRGQAAAIAVLRAIPEAYAVQFVLCARVDHRLVGRL